MINVGVVGAAGYTGQVLLEILLSHPRVNLSAVMSETFNGKPVAEVFPRFTRRSGLVFEADSPASLKEKCEAVFLCLPHKESMKRVPDFLSSGLAVFDLSADFRLKDPAVYEEWYGVKHEARDLIGKAVYGLPELYREKIAGADLVAVPGCYPTSATLAMAPIIGAEWLDKSSIVINSASGVSGAGRKADPRYMLAELEGNMYAYGAPRHRHTPEIEQELSALAGDQVRVTFTPHLLPTARGIHTTVTAGITKTKTRADILAVYREFYADSPFVTVVDGFPEMKWAVGSNSCYIGIALDERSGRLIVASVIDNLVKGASGQAVQCFNIRHGFGEEEGLV